MQGHPQAVLIAFVAALMCMCARETIAHEVDHYNVPIGKHFVDHGPYWNSLLYKTVRTATDSLNQDIVSAQKIPVPSLRKVRLATLQHPSTIAFRVRSNLPSSLMAIEVLEMQFRMQKWSSEPGEKLIAHKPNALKTTYGHMPLLPDPRQLGRMTALRCSMIDVHGTKMGTDKIGHFIGMGYYYYLAYCSSRGLGSSHAVALADARNVGVNGPISEFGVVGMLPTGVVSNADLVANYVGMKFYLNLTQTMMLKGGNYPSMLVREGDFWKLRPHVSPDTDFFAAFISDHYDEALNPNLFEPGSRHQIRKAVLKRRDALLKFYVGNDPEKMNPQHFATISRKLTTYYGEDYGHVGDSSNLIQLADVLFDGRSALPQPIPGSVSKGRVTITMVGPDETQLGDEDTFAVAVTNLTQAPVERLQVITRIPLAFTVGSLGRAAELDRVARTVTWRLSYLGPRETETYRLRVRSASTGFHLQESAVKEAEFGTIAKCDHTTRVYAEHSVAANPATPTTRASSGSPRQRLPTSRISALPIMRR